MRERQSTTPLRNSRYEARVIRIFLLIHDFLCIKPTAARRAFPCWDEPLLKATFAVTLISRADTVNLSNMPAITEDNIQAGVDTPADLSEILANTQNEKWKISKFETTPPMSSYIVAFANGHFEFLETSVVMPLSGKTVPLRIYSEILLYANW